MRGALSGLTVPGIGYQAWIALVDVGPDQGPLLVQVPPRGLHDSC